jgi:hypothetical protein
MLQLSLADLARTLDAGETDVPAMIRRSRKELEAAIDLPPALLDEIQQVAERRLAGVRYDRDADAIVVRRAGGVGGEPDEVRLRVSPRAGDMGRISVDQFFGADGGFSIHAGPPKLPAPDCHQRAGQQQSPESIDVYSATLGGFAAAREAMYRHGRKVSQYGHGTAVQAREPVTSAYVILGIAGTVYVVALAVAALGGGPGATTVANIAVAIAFVAAIAVLVIAILIAFVYLLL